LECYVHETQINMTEQRRIENPEVREQYTSKIKLSFFRHAEPEEKGNKLDADRELTPKGKKQAMEKMAVPDTSQIVVYGSPRKRALETAGFLISESNDEITGNESLEELRKKLDQDLGYGSKIGIKAGLDFDANFRRSEYDKYLIKENFSSGKLIEFLINESDAMAKEKGTKESPTYSKMARSVAEIILKYLKVAPRWEGLVQNSVSSGKNYARELERILVSHQGVLESFLAKLIEKSKGVEERDNFARAIGSGFDVVDGFACEIINRDGNTEVVVEYNGADFKFKESVPKEILEDIIKEGIDYEK